MAYPTQQRLKELLSYNPKTGTFVWISHKQRPDLVGAVAGSLTSCGYLKISVDMVNCLSHRLAWIYMTGDLPKHQIDHINRNRADNSWVNLRSVTNRVNSMNAKVRVDSKYGILGVGWRKSCNRWHWFSNIGVNKKLIHLGHFDDFFEACCARKSAELKYGFHANHGKKI